MENKKTEFTYVMVKPDGVRKGLTDEIIKIFIANDLEIYEMAPERVLDKELIKVHYAHLLDKPFYPELEEFMTSGPVVPMIICGEDAVAKVRTIIGPTNVAKAKEESPNSIRAMYGNPEKGSENIIHASDSVENGLIEIERFFGYTEEKLKRPRVRCIMKSMIL